MRTSWPCQAATVDAGMPACNITAMLGRQLPTTSESFSAENCVGKDSNK
jgi:hypothetical protein